MVFLVRKQEINANNDHSATNRNAQQASFAKDENL
jgi:hypothetical protein